MWLTLKDSDTVDEFYKYTGEELPEVGEVIDAEYAFVCGVARSWIPIGRPAASRSS